ncbi:flagellar motor switch protein FliM [Petroclostridium sp. X23]|uniref:flagellar motor switch protein FliM n=1 Tax=Petroclostridium sp. X23 TaxID=3045146 RepID=UPI0024ACAAB7|nr:flagellar motor switch protein FliM [Petroclostridium sp. X23]WHH58944.1 flagellar motor switch protein FliM [Petroclostridium sp. X23]
MGDILSQNEIDELLKALNTGEIDVNQMKTTTHEKKIREYDFRRPNKFAKEHLRTLNIIHEDYARYVTNFLTAYLRTLVHTEVISVEEISYHEFNNSISNPAILALVDFMPLGGYIILEINPNIIFAIVDRILGGKGLGVDKIRGFTEIELSIVERVVNQLLNLLKEPWENVIELKPRLDRIETNSQFAQIISPNEMVALITLDTKVGDVKGMLNICIPHLVLESVLSKLSTKYWFASIEKEITPQSKKNIEKKIEDTSIPIKVILGKAGISVGDFIELQKGDVIQLDTTVNSDLAIMIGNNHKFNGRPGVRKNRVSVKITDILRKEEDQDE